MSPRHERLRTASQSPLHPHSLPIPRIRRRQLRQRAIQFARNLLRSPETSDERECQAARIPDVTEPARVDAGDQKAGDSIVVRRQGVALAVDPDTPVRERDAGTSLVLAGGTVQSEVSLRWLHFYGVEWTLAVSQRCRRGASSTHRGIEPLPGLLLSDHRVVVVDRSPGVDAVDPPSCEHFDQLPEGRRGPDIAPVLASLLQAIDITRVGKQGGCAVLQAGSLAARVVRG